MREHALAPNSLSTVDTAEIAYLAVCQHFGLEPLPPTGIPDLTLSCFISYFVAKGYKFGTIKTYLSMGPRNLAIKHRIPWIPIKERPLVLRSLHGALRILGDEPTNAKLPLTPSLLLHMLRTLDNSILSAVVRAAALVAFWGALRKSNVAVKSQRLLGHCILRENITFGATGVFVSVCSSKTNQFRRYQHELALPTFAPTDPAYELCPTRALRLLYGYPACCDLPPHVPAFSYMSHGRPVSLTHAQLVRFVKLSLTQLGIDPKKYSGHSFRHGFATLAYQAGLPAFDIQFVGDWKSICFERYISSGSADRLAAINRVKTFVNNLPRRAA